MPGLFRVESSCVGSFHNETKVCRVSFGWNLVVSYLFRMELSCVRYLQDKVELCQSLRGRIKLCRISLGWNRVVSNFFSLELIFSGGIVLCKIFSGRNEFLIRVEWRKTEALIDSQ